MTYTYDRRAKVAGFEQEALGPVSSDDYDDPPLPALFSLNRMKQEMGAYTKKQAEKHLKEDYKRWAKFSDIPMEPSPSFKVDVRGVEIEDGFSPPERSKPGYWWVNAEVKVRVSFELPSVALETLAQRAAGKSSDPLIEKALREDGDSLAYSWPDSPKVKFDDMRFEPLDTTYEVVSVRDGVCQMDFTLTFEGTFTASD